MFFLPVNPSTLPSSCHVSPSPCVYFTGGIKAMTHIDGCLLDRRHTQHIYILNGRSGVGKTQIALKYAQTRKRFFSDILFIDGSSRDTVERCYSSFIVSKNRGTSMEDSLRWLSTHKTNWLIILDGADAPELEFRSFLPSCSHGNVIITTRRSTFPSSFEWPRSESRLTRMNQEDALDLLGKIAGISFPLLSSSQELLELVENAQFLPIPLTFSGLYLKRNSSMRAAESSKLYSEELEKLLRDHSTQPQLQRSSSQMLTQAACTIGFRSLNDHRSYILQVLAFMHHRGIPEAIFQRAAERISTYSPTLPPTETESRVSSFLKTLLDPFLDTENTWKGDNFMLMMAEFLDCSFLDFAQPGALYSMPPCVHAIIAGTHISDTQFFCRVATHLLALAVDPTRDDSEELKFRRLISTHVNSVLIQGENVSLDEAARFVLVYMANGQLEEAETLELEVLEFRRRMLGEDHYLTLSSREQLDTIYMIRGKAGPNNDFDEDSLASLPYSFLSRYTAREIAAWSKLDHPNILEFLGLAVFQNQLVMVSPWISCGSVVEFAIQRGANRCSLCLQLSSAVAYMHSMRVVHGDIKGVNTLVTEDGIVKLTDFGLTIVQEPDVYISITEKGGGTERWMAPELLLEDTAVRSEKADVYALGMTILEIFTGLPPFSNIRRNCAVVAMITRGEKVKYPEELSLYTRHSDRVWEILQGCWEWKPGDRPTAEQIKAAFYEIM